jgi:hypothetical protein
MTKIKDRKPLVGETVYLRGDSRCTAMYLDKAYKKDNVEYGFCIWTAYELFDDELSSQVIEKEFLLEELTIIVPGTAA